MFNRFKENKKVILERLTEIIAMVISVSIIILVADNSETFNRGEKETEDDGLTLWYNDQRYDDYFTSLATDYEKVKGIKVNVKYMSDIDYLENIGMDNVEKIENELLEYAKAEMSKLDFVDIYAPKTNENQIGVLSFNIKDVHPHDTATILSSCGVCVRAGDHCAQPLIRFLNLPATCRASMYIYNTKADIDRLIMALNRANDMFKRWRSVKK